MQGITVGLCNFITGREGEVNAKDAKSAKDTKGFKLVVSAPLAGFALADFDWQNREYVGR